MSRPRALVLTSTGLRHRYFAMKVAQQFEVPTVLTEAKRNYYVQQRQESISIRNHFNAIEAAESDFFGGIEGQPEPSRQVVDDINAQSCIDWAIAQKPDVVCLYGTAILHGGWLDAFPSPIVNLHLGLSPFYRGSATLFWPFANRELQYLGTTIHLATAKIDAGNIIARIDADLRLGEDYYEITSRLIRDSIDAFPGMVADYLTGITQAHPQEAIPSRVCKKADFCEDALSHALAYVDSGLDAEEIGRIMRARACRYSR